MLKKKNKLTSVNHRRLLAGSKKVYTEYLTLHYTKDETIKNTRCAVVVPKKKYKKAAKRNKVRRILFKILTKLYPQLKSKYLLSVIVKKPIDNLTEEELKECVISTLDKIMLKN